MAGFGGAVKLTGESEYRKALKNITNGLRELDSELKVVTSQYDRTDKSEAALTAQTEVLTKKLEAQTAKLQAQENHYKKLSEQVDANRKKHADLKTELEEAIKDLEKIEQESGKSSKAYEMQAAYVNGLTSDYKNSTKEITAQENALSAARVEINNTKAAINKTSSEINKMSGALDDGAKDSKELGTEIEDAGEKAEKSAKGGFTVFKGVISNLATSAIRGAIGAVKQLGGTVVNIGKEAYSSYANYEQLVGGVETLFMDASDTVLKNAKDAYKKAGISANEYMETVTSFSASLVQATGRGEQQDIEQLKAGLDEEYKATKRHLEDDYDARKQAWNRKIKLAKDETYKATLQKQRDDDLKNLKRSNEDALEELKKKHKEEIEVAELANSTSVTTAESLEKAAQIADMALQDMSDNANKMGTDMAAIQNAYQGFAKQNYTMLDNLKLGYGGTKTEMERLLKDAEKVTGIKYDISNLSDVYEAIHVIQGELGITGTTSAEAAETIEGSTKAMSAAWQNLITGLGDDNADFGELVSNFTSSLVGMAKNMLPRITTIIEGMGKLASELLEKVVPPMVEMIPPLLEQGVPILVKAITTTLKTLVGLLPTVIPLATQALSTILTSLLDLLPTALPLIVDGINQLIGGLVTWLASDGNARKLVDAVISVTNQATQSFAMLLPILIPAVVSILGDILAALTDPDNIEAVIETTLVLVGAVIQALVNAIPEIGGVLVKLGDNVGEWLYRYAHQTGLKIGNWLGSVINKIVNFFGSLLSKVKSYLSDIWSKVKSFGSDLISGIKEKFNKVFEIGNSVKTKVSEWISNILGFFKEIPQKVVSIGGNIATGIWSGLKEKMTYLKNKISEFGSEITKKIKSVFKIASPSKLMKTEVGAMLARGIGDGFQMEMKNVTADIEKALPTSFDVNPEIRSGSLNETGGIDYYSMVNAFKQALGEMNIELDDQKVGKFIKKTVSDAIFT